MPTPRCKPWPRDTNQTASGKPGAVHIDPQTWLADVLARLPDHPARHIDDLCCRGTGPGLSPSRSPPDTSSEHDRGLHRRRTEDLHVWLQEKRAALSRSASVAKPIDYMLKRWDRFAVFLDDGRVCLSNNAAERSLRGFALGRKAWLFAGSERGADRAAAMATLIVTAKLNDVDPQAWLAHVLARIADHPAQRLDALLPWNWPHHTGDKPIAEAA